MVKDGGEEVRKGYDGNAARTPFPRGARARSPLSRGTVLFLREGSRKEREGREGSFLGRVFWGEFFGKRFWGRGSERLFRRFVDVGFVSAGFKRAKKQSPQRFLEGDFRKSPLCASLRLCVRFFLRRVFGEFTRIKRMRWIKTDFWGERRQRREISRGGAEDAGTDTV